MKNVRELHAMRKSRRRALRYKLRPRQISYQKGSESGEATLLNISTGGFLVELATVPVACREEIWISLACFGPDRGHESLRLAARVVRVDFDEFAAEFTDQGEGRSHRLLRHLTRFIRQDRCGAPPPLEIESSQQGRQLSTLSV